GANIIGPASAGYRGFADPTKNLFTIARTGPWRRSPKVGHEKAQKGTKRRRRFLPYFLRRLLCLLWPASALFFVCLRAFSWPALVIGESADRDGSYSIATKGAEGTEGFWPVFLLRLLCLLWPASALLFVRLRAFSWPALAIGRRGAETPSLPPDSC